MRLLISFIYLYKMYFVIIIQHFKHLLQENYVRIVIYIFKFPERFF